MGSMSPPEPSADTATASKGSPNFISEISFEKKFRAVIYDLDFLYLL